MRRVLVVDDEENIRLVLKTLLKRHGYDVEVADSGEAALAPVSYTHLDVYKRQAIALRSGVSIYTIHVDVNSSG